MTKAFTRPARHALFTLLAASALTLTITSDLRAANERATFILTSGERVSGTVVFHTSERTNIRADTRQFSLGTNDGKEVHFEFDHVAVIDFVSGNPPQAELEALRPNSHMLAMRDGSMRKGLLVDLIGGDTVRWQREDGDRENVPIRTVRRIYMSTDSARSIFNYTPGAAASTAPAVTAPGRAAPAPPIPSGPGIVVRANVRWTDVGMVNAGELVQFRSSGAILYGFSDQQKASPDGDPGVRRGDLPMPNTPIGALIGRIGNGEPFLIGGTDEPMRMPTRGRLQLSVNDGELTDNGGGFRVLVTRVR